MSLTLGAMMSNRKPTDAALGDPHCGSRGELRWFCFHSHPLAEIPVWRELSRQGFQAFVPLLFEDGKVVPLFSGYGFVSFDPTYDNWKPVAYTRGVRRLLGPGDQPAPVPIGLVEALKQACEGRGFIVPDQVIDPVLAPGTSVDIVSGLFRGHQGQVKHASAERVRLLLELLQGGVMEIELSRRDVVPKG